MDKVSYQVDGKVLFTDLSLDLRRERIAIQGPNGSGKTTLLQIILGEKTQSRGSAKRRYEKLGSIAQNAKDWITEESLATLLSTAKGICSFDDLATLLVAHKFPLSLAQRPLSSLSPGERLRAALICLFERTPSIECLILDEPTYSLDFIGYKALRECLAKWPGGLIVASHDKEFLDIIGIEKYIYLKSCESLPEISSDFEKNESIDQFWQAPFAQESEGQIV